MQSASLSDLTVKVNSNVGFASSGNFRIKMDSEQALVTQVGLIAPATTPSLSSSAGSTSYHAGTFNVAYTYVTAAGETAASPAGSIVITAGQKITVAQLTGLASYVTSVNVYLTAVPAGDTTGYVATASASAGAAGPINLIAEGNGTGAPSSSPSTVWVVQRGIESTAPATHSNGTPVVANLTAAALTTAFVRLDAAASQTLTGPLVIPPTIGGTAPSTNYGSLMLRLDDKSPGGTSTFTFSSIPSGFFALMIWGMARSTAAALVDDLLLRFNGDTSGTYFWAQAFENSGTPQSSAIPTNATSIDIAQIPAGTSSANAPGFVELFIPGYASTSLQKITRSYSGGIESSSQYVQKRLSGLWTIASPTAITSITILTNSGSNFSAGSQFLLYAIP